MKFIAFKILALALEPGSVLVLCGVLGLFGAPNRHRFARVLMGLCVCGFAGLLVLPVGQWLLLPLEQRFPRPVTAPSEVAGIILLGGAEEVELTEQTGTPSFNGSMETLTSFMALSRQFPNALLAFTGGTGAIAGNRLSEADVVRDQLNALGFNHPVIYEGESRDTYENAVLLNQIVQPQAGSTWLLVTAASHMPRSVGCFRTAGWNVIAWPAAFKALRGFAAPFGRLGLSTHLGNLDTALHEWQGLLAYWLLGRTSQLFPAP
jgi:uncharacterized SAM-binding protein YcdF (DUF218 family)